MGIEYADFRLENADSILRIFIENLTGINFQIINIGLTLGRLATCTAGLKTKFIDTYIDTDLIFRGNGIEFFQLNDQSSLLEVAVGHALSAPDIYSNDYLNRTRQIDTVFFGSVVSADARVEYMRWNYLSQNLDFNAPIDNIGLNIKGNIF